MNAQMYALVVGSLLLLYPTLEDLKYRMVTPLPVLLLLIGGIVGNLVFARSYWTLYFLILTGVVLAVYRQHFSDALPPTDVFILLAGLSVIWTPMLLIVFTWTLAAVDIGIRLVMSPRIGFRRAFLETPLPLAPIVFIALLITAIGYLTGGMTV